MRVTTTVQEEAISCRKEAKMQRSMPGRQKAPEKVDEWAKEKSNLKEMLEQTKNAEVQHLNGMEEMQRASDQDGERWLGRVRGVKIGQVL